MADNPDQVWANGFTMTAIKAGVVTGLLLLGLVLMFTLGNLQEIQKNFPKYRCNPIMMPFASLLGFNAKDNFNFCLSSIFNGKAAEIFGPIYNLLGGFTQIVKLIVDVALGIRKLFSNFLMGVNGFVRSVRDRIQGLMFNIRMSFLKINSLMGRVYGTMYAVIWMGVSAMTAGFNIADNDLVRFLFEFCFDPDTPIQLEDGSFVPISHVRIGTRLAALADTSVPVVTSRFEFQGDKTPMVNVHGVVMSASHYVKAGESWVPAEEHPEAIPAASVPKLICLNVSGHTFMVGKGDPALLVADYDEHSSDKVVHATQKLAMAALNGTSESSQTRSDYSLGIDPTCEVRMRDNTWQPMSALQLGDDVWNAGKVLGLVQEQCDQVCEISGKLFAAAQTIYDGKWVRVAEKAPVSVSVSTKSVLLSLITERCATIHIRCGQESYYIRDYREVPLPEMEDSYEDEFSS